MQKLTLRESHGEGGWVSLSVSTRSRGWVVATRSSTQSNKSLQVDEDLIPNEVVVDADMHVLCHGDQDRQ